MKPRDQWTSEEEDAWIRAHESKDDSDDCDFFAIGRDVFGAMLIVMGIMALLFAVFINVGCGRDARDTRNADWSQNGGKPSTPKK